jgi:hypothetical protein
VGSTRASNLRSLVNTSSACSALMAPEERSIRKCSPLRTSTPSTTRASSCIRVYGDEGTTATLEGVFVDSSGHAHYADPVRIVI